MKMILIRNKMMICTSCLPCLASMLTTWHWEHREKLPKKAPERECAQTCLQDFIPASQPQISLA